MTKLVLRNDHTFQLLSLYLENVGLLEQLIPQGDFGCKLLLQLVSDVFGQVTGAMSQAQLTQLFFQLVQFLSSRCAGQSPAPGSDLWGVTLSTSMVFFRCSRSVWDITFSIPVGEPHIGFRGVTYSISVKGHTHKHQFGCDTQDIS